MVPSTALQSIPLFASLSSDEQTRVAAVARLVHFDPGQLIVNEGESALDFYAITEGAVEVRQGGKPLRLLGAGDLVGEMGVVPRAGERWTRRRTAAVRVLEPTDAIAIAGSSLRQLIDEIPVLADQIRETMQSRLHSDPAF